MNVPYYGYECGVLLTKENPEFEAYAINNKALPYGFYDEDQGFCREQDLVSVRQKMRQYVEDGVENTYAVISAQGMCKSSEQNEILQGVSISDNMDYSFFKNESEIVYSVCKQNGKLVEGFLEELVVQALINDTKELMADMLRHRGYRVNEERFAALWEIYEDCQEWSEEGKMLSGLTYDEVADFVKHSKSVDEVFSFIDKEVTLIIRVPKDFDREDERMLDDAFADIVYKQGWELIDSKEYRDITYEKYIPCEYVSVWDGSKYQLSFPAKYDPETNKIFDIQLSAEDLGDCQVLCGEFMVLQGNWFFLGEPYADGSIPVGEPYKITEEKTNVDFPQKQSLADKIASASARSGPAEIKAAAAERGSTHASDTTQKKSTPERN